MTSMILKCLCIMITIVIHEQQINLAKRNGSLIIESYILLKMYDKYTKNELTREECINMFQEEGLLVL